MQVSHKQSKAHIGSVVADVDALLPAWYMPRSPSQSALRQQSLHQHCHPGLDSSVCQLYSSDAAGNGQCSFRKSWQQKGARNQHCSSMDTLCKDMQQLDAQIADLDLNLASASRSLRP